MALLGGLNGALEGIRIPDRRYRKAHLKPLNAALLGFSHLQLTLITANLSFFGDTLVTHLYYNIWMMHNASNE